MFFLPFLFSYFFFFLKKIYNIAKIIKTNTAKPRHPYRTRANSKNMEDWETAQETIKAYINQLKDQVGQILEALKSLKATGEASCSKGEESTHGALVAFPAYGLPSGYTPPVGEYSEAEHASFSFQINTLGNEAATFAGPRETVMPKTLNTIIGDNSLDKITSHPTMQAVSADVEETKTKLEILEERLRAIERGGNYAFGDVAGLSLVHDVTIPDKFKVPEFKKYKGTTCPRSHLTMYCRKMVADEFKFLPSFNI